MTRNDKIAALLQKRQEHDIRELNKAVNEFRHSHQQPDGRREFDLNDPDSLKKDKPARVSDDDPRCGVASLQKFVGEDLNAKARQKLQQEQARLVVTRITLSHVLLTLSGPRHLKIPVFTLATNANPLGSRNNPFDSTEL